MPAHQRAIRSQKAPLAARAADAQTGENQAQRTRRAPESAGKRGVSPSRLREGLEKPGALRLPIHEARNACELLPHQYHPLARSVPLCRPNQHRHRACELAGGVQTLRLEHRHVRPGSDGL